MQPQSEPLHPLSQHLRHPLRVLALLESDDKITAVTHQHRLASQAWLHLALEPLVQHLMQIDVAQRRIWEPYDYGNLSSCGR